VRGYQVEPDPRRWLRLYGGGTAVLNWREPLTSSRWLANAVEETPDDIRARRALDHEPCLRGFAETRYRAKSCNTERRVCAPFFDAGDLVAMRSPMTSPWPLFQGRATTQNATRFALGPCWSCQILWGLW